LYNIITSLYCINNKMYLIVGLGNPEQDYSKTRHNMGFNVINKISEKYNIAVNKSKFKGLFRNGINRK